MVVVRLLGFGNHTGRNRSDGSWSSVLAGLRRRESVPLGRMVVDDVFVLCGSNRSALQGAASGLKVLI